MSADRKGPAFDPPNGSSEGVVKVLGGKDGAEVLGSIVAVRFESPGGQARTAGWILDAGLHLGLGWDPIQDVGDLCISSSLKGAKEVVRESWLGP